MADEKKVKCPWCEKENSPEVSKDKSEYGEIVKRTCTECGKIVASYLDEGHPVLEKVRTFQN